MPYTAKIFDEKENPVMDIIVTQFSQEVNSPFAHNVFTGGRVT